MRNFILLLLAVQFHFITAQDQLNHFKFRVYLKDKPTFDLAKVDTLSLLSTKSLERRKEQKVEIDSTDFPLSVRYKEIIRRQGVDIVAESKWFNTIVIECSDSVDIKKIQNLNFVDSTKFVWTGISKSSCNYVRPRLKAVNYETDTVHNDYYGVSEPQFTLHNANYMLNAGFMGKGIDIAVIDAGFTNLDVIPSFVHSFIVGNKNFVPGSDIFSVNDHGTKVLSTMAINLPNKVMGSAPHASYLLLCSEDPSTEFLVEEDYWIAAIEYADSIGVKLVNTSLGYNQFDDSSLDYTHEELTGKTSLMSRAVDKAFDKGMLIVGSAGNEGNKSWEKITVPGDSKSMLTVGAISLDSTIASFSSIGPTADGRIKPDLVSIGRGAVTIDATGEIGYHNGTSFSSPFLAGLIGSLWSVNPKLNRNELIDIVRKSGHQFNQPDSIFGYGIPNFGIAYQAVLNTLKQADKYFENDLMQVSVTNKDLLVITVNDTQYQPQSYSLRILNEKGNPLVKEPFESYDYIYTLTEELIEENDELFIVVQAPFEQNVVRFKIK
ncbi:MAG: S8 family serine peptidase [Dysgonamonadaceae bacterium]|nr:S8 family serine peptidase [Dysgonamonadaceae bacterium]